MPINPTNPGVSIEAIPNGKHTIMGVATSVTAFIGRALRGPVNQATAITSYADFERTFGGLWSSSAMSYAVRDFFQNGGSQAVIVRLFHSGAATSLPAQLTVGELTLQAVSPGAWGNKVRARIEVAPQRTLLEDVAERLGVATSDLFNLLVHDNDTGVTERFLNVTVVDSPQRVDKVLQSQSNLVLASGSLPSSPPLANPDPASADRMWSDEGSNRASTGVSAPVDDGGVLTLTDDFIPGGPGSAQTSKRGLYSLEQVDLFNLLCIPPYRMSNDADAALVHAAATYCMTRRAVLIVDPPATWTDANTVVSQMNRGTDLIGTRSEHAAAFFPAIVEPNPLRENQLETFAPCGAVAGVIARTDSQHGVWKAPAGVDAVLHGVPQLALSLTDGEIGVLNSLGINCLRTMPGIGQVIWGARTLQGGDRLASDWKYLPIRRLALFLEESLYRGTRWVVFEPNDEPLWAQIRRNVGAFMYNLFRQGAFQGQTPSQAYFVQCDSETMTQDDISHGTVNIVVGFAPLKPAEFVIIKVQQVAGQMRV